MALLKSLPNLNGPLSHHVPSSTIVAANKEVKPLLEKTLLRECGKYYVYTEEEKFLVKRAVEMGTTNTIRHFQKNFAEHPLKEGIVRSCEESCGNGGQKHY